MNSPHFQTRRRFSSRALGPLTALVILPMVGLVVFIPTVHAAADTSSASPSTNIVQMARSAVKSGELVFRLTTPEELKALLGAPEKERNEKEGDGKILILEYPSVQAVFGQFGENPYATLFAVSIDGVPLDIGRDKPVTLRRLDDLVRLDTFWGVTGMSLIKLDLTAQMARLNELPFDSRTQWPAPEKMPKEFIPTQLLEDGKNPGLGVRKLHSQAIDGRGIHIAIIDQPLLRDHCEYKDRLADYTAIEVEGAPVQMHGPPVTSIAVGKTCGTAPAASVHYYAVPTWKWWNEHCKPYAATVERIIERNKTLPAADKIRVISLSLGAMSQWPDHELWAKAVQRAADDGILVVTCDHADYRLMMLKRQAGADADAAASYLCQFRVGRGDVLCVPAGNRTTAAHTGTNDYVFWRNGGMSWTVPYLAGLAALAFQVDPALKPQAIPGLWTKTATRTAAGLIVNPPAFIEAVRGAKSSSKPAPSPSAS